MINGKLGNIFAEYLEDKENRPDENEQFAKPKQQTVSKYMERGSVSLFTRDMKI